MFKSRQIHVVVFILFSILFIASSVVAQSKVGTAAVPTLLWQNSPRTKALGGCSIILVDEQSQFYNPAAMGVFSLDNVAALNISNKTDPLPSGNSGDQKLRTWGFMVRFLPLGGKTSGWTSDYGIAFGFGKSRFDAQVPYTSYEYWDGSGYPGGEIFTSFDAWSVYSGAFAFRTGHFVLGTGFSYKYVTEDLSYLAFKGHCYDMGILASLGTSGVYSLPPTKGFRGGASAGIVIANIGTMHYISHSYDFPEVSIFGISGTFSYKDARNIDISFMPTIQYEAYGKIRQNISRIGGEAIFNGAIFARIGYTMNEFYDGDYVSYGFGLSLNGIYYNLLFPSKKTGRQNNILSYFDIHFDFARSRLLPFEKTNFYNVSISL